MLIGGGAAGGESIRSLGVRSDRALFAPSRGISKARGQRAAAPQMRRAPGAWVLLLAVLAAAQQGATSKPSGEVVTLEDDTFDGLTGSGVWMVDIYAPW
jgi:hypothetical protein